MKKVLLFCALGLASAAASAADFHNWSVGVAGGQAFPVGTDIFKGAEREQFHGSAWVRYHLSNPFALEFNYERLDYLAKPGNDGDTKIDAYTVNAVLQGRLGRRWSQVGAVGAGLGDVNHFGPQRYKDLFLLARYGFTYDLTPAWTAGVHAQYSYTGQSNNRSPAETRSMSYLVSLAYSFGGSTSASAETVHNEPAPAPVPVAALDSDHDGVPDSMDKCPNTPAGVKVNAYGCQEHEKATSQLDLEFPSGKATVTPAMQPMLKELATFMKDNPKTSIAIEGYTDNTGSAKTNKRLSQARASAIRQSLIEDFQVSGTRLTAKGFGSAKPVADNSTADGRKQNRRVMTVIEEQ